MADLIATRWEHFNETGRRLFADGELAAAERAFVAAIREAEHFGNNDLRLAASLSNLGQLYYKQRNFVRAEALCRRALAIREAELGPEHCGVVQSINTLAALYYVRGELDRAEPLFQRALAISERHLGPWHTDVAVCLNNLARLHFTRNDFAAAAPPLLRLLALKERALGPDHPEVATVLTSLIKVRSAQGDHAAAEELCRRVLAIRERTAPENPRAIATALERVAEACAAQGKLEAVSELRQRALTLRAGGDASVHRRVTVGVAAVAKGSRGAPTRRQVVRHSVNASSAAASGPPRSETAAAAADAHASTRVAPATVQAPARSPARWLGLAAALTTIAIGTWVMSGRRSGDSATLTASSARAITAEADGRPAGDRHPSDTPTSPAVRERDSASRRTVGARPIPAPADAPARAGGETAAADAVHLPSVTIGDISRAADSAGSRVDSVTRTINVEPPGLESRSP